MKMIEVNLTTGKVKEREWTEEEKKSHELATNQDVENLTKSEIKQKLFEIDLKSIRAIREGNQTIISELEAQAGELRKQL